MDLLLDSDGDLAIVNGDAVLIDSLNAIRQKLSIRLQIFKGEWFLDENKGIPYHQTIFKKGVPLPVIQSVFRRSIMTMPGIKSVEHLAFDLDTATRKLAIKLKATAITDEPLEYSTEQSI